MSMSQPRCSCKAPCSGLTLSSCESLCMMSTPCFRVDTQLDGHVLTARPPEASMYTFRAIIIAA